MTYWLLAMFWAGIFCALRILGGAYRSLSVIHLLSLPILGIHVFLVSFGVDPAPYVLTMLAAAASWALDDIYKHKNRYQERILITMLLMHFLAVADWVWRGSTIIEGWYFAVECLIIMSACGGIYELVKWIRSGDGGHHSSADKHSDLLLRDKRQGNRLCQ